MKLAITAALLAMGAIPVITSGPAQAGNPHCDSILANAGGNNFNSIYAACCRDAVVAGQPPCAGPAGQSAPPPQAPPVAPPPPPPAPVAPPPTPPAPPVLAAPPSDQPQQPQLGSQCNDAAFAAANEMFCATVPHDVAPNNKAYTNGVDQSPN